MLYELELGHNAAVTTLKNCCTKGENAVIHSTVDR